MAAPYVANPYQASPLAAPYFANPYLTSPNAAPYASPYLSNPYGINPYFADPFGLTETLPVAPGPAAEEPEKASESIKGAMQ